MNDRFRISSLLAERLAEHKVALPTLLRRAGLPAGFFQQEKIYATTAELFALWRAIAETSGDAAIGLKFGAEPRLERYHPTAMAAVCSRSFRDALQRLARYKQLTCPEEIRVHTTRDEASVEFFYLEAERSPTRRDGGSVPVMDCVHRSPWHRWTTHASATGTHPSRPEPRVAGNPLWLPRAVQSRAQRACFSQQRPRSAIRNPQ